ncbi:MotE family protein [Sulfitobacter sp.]|uniref:MotE family protein n=1 Tax=Sulfitobacter sp. TaxID=1903071 RepID=UPI00300310D3
MIFSVFKRMRRPVGRGSVLVIALLLISSATIRVITSASSVFAQDGQLPTTPLSLAAAVSSKTTDAAEKENMSHVETHMPIAATANRAELSGLIAALSEREVQVLEREKKIEMRMRALSVADAEIEKRIEALTQTEAALRATLSLADEASEKDIQRLTSVYENMKPKDAAILFEQMEPSFAAGFLGRMRPDVAADIMSGLSPQVAYSISVILAGRNANVPKK